MCLQYVSYCPDIMQKFGGINCSLIHSVTVSYCRQVPSCVIAKCVYCITAGVPGYKCSVCLLSATGKETCLFVC